MKSRPQYISLHVLPPRATRPAQVLHRIIQSANVALDALDDTERALGQWHELTEEQKADAGKSLNADSVAVVNAAESLLSARPKDELKTAKKNSP